MKLLRERFSVTIFSEGKFCWKNPKWTPKPKDEYEFDKKCLLIFIVGTVVYFLI